MKLIEADGKRILKDAGIAIPSQDLTYPVFLKAQVLQGRRGLRGLVSRCLDAEEVEQTKRKMSEQLLGIPYAGFLCESEVMHEKEWLVAVHFDRRLACVCVSFSNQGGMDVAHAECRPVSSVDDIRSIGLPEGVTDVLLRLYLAFLKHDALHLEINPLACRSDGSCVALDAKVELDDAAAFRHPEWNMFTRLEEVRSDRERAYIELLSAGGHRGTMGRFVELDGDIALVLSGGGASLVAIDALKLAGGRPANYVEMSGNPDPEELRKAAEIVLSKPGLRAIWIAGSFANFTDIRSTVNAVLAAIDNLGLRIPIVIRRDGPQAIEAKADAEAWASARNISLRFDQADVDFDASARAVVACSRL